MRFSYSAIEAVLLCVSVSGFALYLHARVLWIKANQTFSRKEKLVCIAGEVSAAVLAVLALLLILEMP